MQAPDFWSSSERAKVIAQRVNELNKEIATWDEVEKGVADLDELAASGDESFRADITADLDALEARFTELEFHVLFSGRYDQSDAIVAFHAGAGGTEAQDWAEMLMRMIMRFCEKKGFSVRLLFESKGEEAGIKSATLEIKGRYAYGWLRSEHGVHRLVRISPYDSAKARHTSFANIEVIPDIGEAAEVKIEPSDLRIDTFLSGGHGGQSVQTTYSAVRIVHLPTGIIVTCQNERSQLQNRETAMKLLRSKLAVIEAEKQEAEKQKLRGEYHSAEWGNQIRSYVLQPYKMVRDHRTKFRVTDTDKVLNGWLDPFVESTLKYFKDPEGYAKTHQAEDDDEE
jgi:peptide chain release factor 2